MKVSQFPVDIFLLQTSNVGPFIIKKGSASQYFFLMDEMNGVFIQKGVNKLSVELTVNSNSNECMHVLTN